MIILIIVYEAVPYDDRLPTGCASYVYMMSIEAQPTTLITINPIERNYPSLGSQPWSILAFQDLRFTSVTTGKLPKRLGPRVCVY